LRATVTFAGDTYVATSLWTYRPPPPEPPLGPPVVTWERDDAFLRLLFPTRFNHRYRLWQQLGLGIGAPWTSVDTFIAQEVEGQFEIWLSPGEGNPWVYRVGVEPPNPGP
jgi:hypothetical protein